MKNKTNISTFVGLLIVIFYVFGTFNNSDFLTLENNQNISYNFLNDQNSFFLEQQPTLFIYDIKGKEIEEQNDENDENDNHCFVWNKLVDFSINSQVTTKLPNNIINIDRFHFLYLLFENFRL